MLNLSINSHVYASLRNMAVLPGARLSGEPSKTRVNERRSRDKIENFSSCSRTNLLDVSLPLFSALNQNRHATQATFTPNGKREFVPRYQVFPLVVVYCLRYRSLSLYRAPTCFGLLFVLACRKSPFSLRGITLGKHARDSCMRRGNKKTLRGFRLVLHLILRSMTLSKMDT